MWHISSLLSLTDDFSPLPFVLIRGSGGQTAVAGSVDLGASDVDVIFSHPRERTRRRERERAGGARRLLCQTSITSVLS